MKLFLLSADGSDSRDKPKLYRLQLSVTEVGTEKFDEDSIQVHGRGSSALGSAYIWVGRGKGPTVKVCHM